MADTIEIDGVTLDLRGYYDPYVLARYSVHLFNVKPNLALAALLDDGRGIYSIPKAKEIIEGYGEAEVTHEGTDSDAPTGWSRIVEQEIFTSQDAERLKKLWASLQEDFTREDVVIVFTD